MATGLYLAATIAALVGVIRHDLPRALLPRLLWGGFAAHAASIAVRSWNAGHLAVTTFDEALSFLALLLVAIFLLVLRHSDASTLAVIKAVKGHEIVYNFAGLSDLNESISKPRQTLELNVMGNINILEASVKAGVKRYIYASTVYVSSKKGSFYGISKNTSEKIIEEYANDLREIIRRLRRRLN